MKLIKKTFYLNYTEQKGEKEINKSYIFNANVNVADTTLKEVGDELTKLVSKTINDITLNTKSRF